MGHPLLRKVSDYLHERQNSKPLVGSTWMHPSNRTYIVMESLIVNMILSENHLSKILTSIDLWGLKVWWFLNLHIFMKFKFSGSKSGLALNFSKCQFIEVSECEEVGSAFQNSFEFGSTWHGLEIVQVGSTVPVWLSFCLLGFSSLFIFLFHIPLSPFKSLSFCALKP